MKVGVLGTGYVGLVAGAGFADFGNEVICVDIDAERVAALNRGEVPIHEPGLPELVRENLAAGRLSFGTDVAAAVRDAEVVLICVGTPPAESGQADLSQVDAAARAIGQALRQSPRQSLTVIINKSTVPVGTAERVHRIVVGELEGKANGDMAAAPSARPFAVVSNPEFLKEGSAVEDFLRPMRVIVGLGPTHGLDGPEDHSGTEKVRAIMRHLYHPVVRTNDRLLFCDARSAELCKYASNAYLATRISFINDIANLCERVGADVELVRRGMGMDTRIGPSFLFPGIGYGGSCFPKDTRALVSIAQAHGMGLPLIEAAERINARQRRLLADKLLGHFGVEGADPDARPLTGRTIAVWGLAFKPETDDVREAPALAIIEHLVRCGARVHATDPVANRTAAAALVQLGVGERVSFFHDAYEAATGADALMLCTEWRQFRQPNFTRLQQLLAGTGVFDGRNIWDPDELRKHGFRYYGIGRP